MRVRDRIYPVLRALAVLTAAVLLFLALTWERHEVRSGSDSGLGQISGSEFIRGASVDRYQLRADGLYDTHSQSVPEGATLDDCPT